MPACCATTPRCRAALTGCSWPGCAGETTLAGRVGQVLGAPHTEIDSLFHGPGWVPRTDFLDDVRTLVSAEAWTTEWQYAHARPLLLARADLLVWLDLSGSLHAVAVTS